MLFRVGVTEKRVLFREGGVLFRMCGVQQVGNYYLNSPHSEVYRIYPVSLGYN